ncbi:uncharacterized protein CTRU02_215469 [Colletotrichum truncatum]|uniref:Uncharacterized protein n=1 Tax=Colletotrichum truncatum TaxID=5467 RepID=A0ACC3YCN0_COLTU|nr:uncharacterized protein CTRU02_05589 [Colletotrichum truncatum]KAF6794032.1 hypothetical protein CTRU02_05589 [Colletotrichum truncatum]
MNVNTTMKSVCVPPRCGVCRFEIQHGDSIVAVRPLDSERSQPYKHSIVGFTDSDPDMEFFECCGRCHHDEQRVGYHVECISGISNATLSKILETTASAYDPPVIAQQRRIRWFQSRLATILKTATRHILHLPEEVRNIIAKWALDSRITRHRLATDYAIKRCTGEMGVVSSGLSVKICEKIYARYVDFEGVQYIAYLTNTASDERDIILFDPSSPTSIDSLYISSDHLGVRQLLFACSSEQCTIEQAVGIWWRTVKLESLGGLIRSRSDGLKLRDLHGANTVLSDVFWDLPQFPPRHIRFESLCNAEPGDHMSTVSCNDPQNTAYSLCWNRKIVMLHSHRAEENLDFYQYMRTTDETALWLYMPMHADEILTEIWRFNGPFKSAIALLLVTNQGRSIFLGVQPRTNWSRSDYTLLDLPSKSSSRIYAETTTFGVRSLGFETPRPNPQDRIPRVDWPISSYPIFRPHENFAWNRAKLSDVVQFVPCYGNIHRKTIIIGLLLHYTDGKTACVGQIRLDRLGDALSIHSVRKLWLGFWLTDDGPCVSHAVLAPEQPTLLDCESWFGVDWCGDLEWWFSNRQCQLFYQGRLSPRTTMFGRSRV